MKKLISLLMQRGFVYDKTNKLLEIEKPLTVYLGFDPTASSLHIGHLTGILALQWLRKFDCKVFAVAGGATGMIGDPSGKNKERNLLDAEVLSNNLKCLTRSLQKLLGPDITVLNNYEWLSRFSLLDFLRDIGKYFRVGSMMAKDSVKQRFTSEEGISFTEFGYQLLQAYDFLYLHEYHDVSLQIGGSDQWGNITAGIDLIRRKKEKEVYGMTFPLLVDAEGKKMGKTAEGNTVWLDEEKTSVYDFYQYFYRLPDSEMKKMFGMLTFLEQKEIDGLLEKMRLSDYVPGFIQQILASEVTRFVHGDRGLEKAKEITLHLSPGNETVLTKQSLEFFKNAKLSISMETKNVLGKCVVDVAVAVQLCKTKGECRRLISQQGLYLNNNPISEEKRIIEKEDIIEGEFILLASGKKKKTIINLIK